jgi:hypothetical protein
MSVTWKVMGLVLMTVAAAGAARHAAAEEALHTRDVTVTSDRGVRYEGNVAAIDVREVGTPAVEVSLWAEGPGGAWSAGFGLSAEALLSGAGTVRLGLLPLGPSVGNLAVGPSDDPVLVESGSLSFTLTAATRGIEGRATTSPGDGSASFQGGYVLRCWVRPESLGLPANGEVEPGMVLLVPDERGASEFCRHFAELR